MVQKRVKTPSQKDAKRQHILTFAAAEFAQFGFEQANINVIAEKAGVGKGTMYRYSSSKEQLFQSVLAETAEKLSAALDQAIEDSEGLPGIERFRLMVRCVVLLEREFPDFIAVQNATLFGISHRQFQTAGVEVLRRTITQLEEIFSKELVDRKIRPIDTHKLAIFLGRELQTYNQTLGLLGVDIPNPGEFLSDLFWNGLKPS